jgi:hypothetical protein
MKKITFVITALLAMLTISCTEQISNSTVPSATVWRSTTFIDSSLTAVLEYYEFRFVSPSTLELWVKRTENSNPEKVNQAYTYTTKGNILSISYNDVTATGTIDKTKIRVTEDGTTLEFVKM